jgi:small-conductance mechanosensitive channel
MDTTNFWHLLDDLLRNLITGPLQRLWPWPLIAMGAALGLSYGGWRLIRPRISVLEQKGAGPSVLAALFVRLLPSGLVIATSLAGYWALRAAGEYAEALVALTVLAGVLLLSRLGVFVLLRLLAPLRRMSLNERILGWAAWVLLLLLLLGRLGPVITAIDSVAIPLGNSRVSLLDAIRALLVLLLLVGGASYLGALIERRVLTLAQLPIGLRVGIGKLVRVLLVLIAVMLALSSVGLDLTTLTVIGGAVGVGLGFGLQRIASNFVSGFVLLGDRSIRPGDVITIGTRFGVVRELRARYVVVRDRDGVDTLIPNENIITSEVINWSYADRQVRLKLPVRISYRDNPRQAMALMERAASSHVRVEKEPVPAARLVGFAENGIDLELRFWIRDPEDGVNNIRSDVYLEIWDAFKAASITFPFPQRDVHLHGPDPQN